MSGHADVLDRMPEFAGSLVDADRLIEEIDEPLRQSAPIMFERAMDTCERKTVGDDCHAYHAVWQYLRLANVSRGVRADGALFVGAAEHLARAGLLKHALVSATADYSMLAHLAYRARRAGATTSFDVVDRCGTPLFMNDWYAAQRGLSVRTFHSDIFSFRPDRQYMT